MIHLTPKQKLTRYTAEIESARALVKYFLDQREPHSAAVWTDAVLRLTKERDTLKAKISEKIAEAQS